MPKIRLKPNSPEFHDPANSTQRTALCDMPGCKHTGEFRAPKDRSLSDHYWFCQDHVRDYNKAWNFFDGMAESEVQDIMHKSLYGDRPTWRYGVNGKDAAEELFNKAWQTYNFTDEEPPKYNAHDPKNGTFSQHSQEHKALALMGLVPPVTLKGIKAKYKELAKKHHPDLNRGCAKSEELLKEINMAYTILKLAYEKFETLPERS